MYNGMVTILFNKDREVSLKKFYIKNYVRKLYISQQYIKILARGLSSNTMC